MSRKGSGSSDRVLVLGASGFVGQALVPYLRALLDVPVVAVCRSPIAGAVQGDSLDAVPVEPDERVTAVVLASQSDANVAQNDPGATFLTNVSIAVQAAEWLRAHPASRLLYLSSAEVTGNSAEPLTEDAPAALGAPRKPYAASKAAAEVALRTYQDHYGLDLSILRPCNLVGGQQRGRKLLPIIVRRLLAGQAIPIDGTGSQRRQWLSVSDLCSAIALGIDGGLEPSTYNCGPDSSLDVVEVVTAVADALEARLELEYRPGRPGGDDSILVSSQRLRGAGWAPEFDARAAIQHAATELATAARGGVDLFEV